MDKMKRTLRDLSLPGSLVLYIAIFVMLALVLSVMTNSICERAAESIRTSYPASGEKYYLTNEKGERLGDGVYIGKEFVPLSPSDERTINLLKQIPLIAAPVYSALCIIAAALLFYRKKLRKPLAELRTASEKISNNDLDFSIGYDSKDELGRLVGSFETMRAMLANNFSEMWRQVEERKRLNAAFAHDLRTPLTVLKGYNEMLQASEHVQTKEIAATMGKHLARMEAYVNSMSNLRRLEDTRPEYKSVPLQQFLSSLQESIMMKSGQIVQFGKLQNIISEINGQVWECVVPSARAEEYAATFNTSNLRNLENNKTALRIIADRPPMEKAVRVQPNLEDLYLFYFKGDAENDKNDSI